MAVGIRTAPAVTGAVTSTLLTLHVMDASGDFWADCIGVTSAPTDIQIEAWAAAYQAASQASLYKVSTQSIWEGDADSDNAGTDQRSTIAEGINLLYKDIAAMKSQTPRLVAPILAVMQGNQDIPLLSSTEMTNLITAELAIMSTYALNSAQFTGRRERSNNPRISA